MNDSLGNRIEIGDEVQLWPDHVGRVVCSFDDAQFSQQFDQKSWGHLAKGVLLLLRDGNILHYEEPDEDLVILEKCIERKNTRLTKQR